MYGNGDYIGPLVEGISYKTIKPKNPARRRYKRRFRLRKHEFRLYLRSLFRDKHETTKRFAVLSHVRSGSFLLRDLLNCHPDVICDREVFQANRVLSPRRFLEQSAGRKLQTAHGFLVKPGHPVVAQGFSTQEWIDFLRSMEFSIIHIERRDFWAQALSMALARARLVWHTSKQSDVKKGPVTIDPAQVRMWFDYIHSWDPALKAWLEALPHISLSYDDDLKNADRHQQALDRVFEFLDLPGAEVKARLIRTSGSNPSDYISNWDEVAAFRDEMMAAS